MSSAVTLVSTAAIPPVFSPPILHLDAHHWWPTVSSLGKSVWANRSSCVGSPSLRTTGASLSSTVIYSSIFSSASSGHDFTPGSTHSVVCQPIAPDAFRASCSSRMAFATSYRAPVSLNEILQRWCLPTSLNLFSALNGGVFVTIPIKRRNIDLGQVHHAFLHLQALRLTSLRCCAILSVSAPRADVDAEASTSVFGDSEAVLSTLPC